MDSTIRPERLAEGVYLVPLQASNVYVWESDGLLSVVDTGVSGSADANFSPQWTRSATHRKP